MSEPVERRIEALEDARRGYKRDLGAALAENEDLRARLAAVETERNNIAGHYARVLIKLDDTRAERDEARQAIARILKYVSECDRYNKWPPAEEIRSLALPVAARPGPDAR